MTTLAVTVAATAIAWLAAFGFFILALRARWLARYPGGFFVSMLIALVGVALMSASVVGAWGYEAAKRILDQKLAIELQDVGTIIESEVAEDVAWVRGGLTTLGGSMVPLIERAAPAAELQAGLRVAQTFNDRFLQLDVFDREGRLSRVTPEARSVRSRAAWRSHSASTASPSCPTPCSRRFTGARSSTSACRCEPELDRSSASSAAGTTCSPNSSSW
jgi:hypothetical protein